jgi:hypothetical protein
MPTQPTIPKNVAAELALDRQRLFALGQRHVQRHSSRIWNDYNVHDPGITTLELLSYSLTDLAYRASLSIPDLLAEEKNNADNMRAQFITARRILPNRAVTLGDYRKLLIDLKDVKNAWLFPAKVEYFADTVNRRLVREDNGAAGLVPVAVKGVYDVLLEFMDDVTAPADKQAIVERVRERLHANRSLCEDFASILEVSRESFLLCGEFELEASADVSQVHAEILFQVQQQLAPPVTRHTLEEMLQRTHPDGTAYTPDDIFHGPLLDHGFIADDDLEKADLRTSIRLSDIINVLMDIEGVQAVREVVINPADVKSPLENKWIVAIKDGHQPLIDNNHSRLVFYKQNMPVTSLLAKVNEHMARLVEKARHQRETAFEDDLAIPLGKHRETASYFSFQNHYPATYGIGEVGLSEAADQPRRALAYQLKGYLLFFDQLMANYLAQLSHLKDLFSTDPHLLRTYFYQKVESFVGCDAIYAEGDPVQQFQAAFEDRREVLNRRHRFLDHLLARFAEGFKVFTDIMSTTFGFSSESMVGYKCAFLQHYAEISGERGLAYNWTLAAEADVWNSDNVSGLEKRLARLLGIRNFSRRNLSSNSETGIEIVELAPGGAFGYTIKHTATNAILLEHPPDTTLTQSAARELARLALEAAMLPSAYEPILRDGKHAFHIVGNDVVLATSHESFDTEEERRAHVDDVVDYLRLNHSNEGMFVVEAILLRPEQADDPLLPISQDPEADEEADLDPYSYRLHIFLPAYGSRFKSMEFRRYAEDVIREETPAHLLPKVCWISVEDMTRLESHYHDWLDLKSTRDPTDRTNKLNTFVKTLFGVKNVYPTQILRECDSGEDQPKFILGQSALGTMEENE